MCDATSAWIPLESSEDHGVNAVLGHALSVHPADLFDPGLDATDQDLLLRLRVWNPAEEQNDLDRHAHLFWDAVHPTKKAHAYLGELALGKLPVPN